jgi:Tape measure protein
VPTSLGTIYGSVRLRTDTLTSDATSIKGLFDELRQAAANLFDGLNIGQQFADAVAGIPATAEEAMSGVADAVKTGTADAGVAAEEGMTRVSDAVQTGTADAEDAAKTGASRIQEVFSSLRDGLGGVASGISERVSGAFSAVGESGEALAEKMGGLHKGLGKLGEGFKEALGHATEFAAGMLEFQALNGAMSAVGDFASNLIGMNSTFESLHQQLTSITGSSGAADKLLNWVKDFGQHIPDTTEHLAESVVTIQSLGVNAQQVLPSIANVAAAMGTDLPTASKAFADAFEGRFQMMQMELHVSKDQLEQFGLKMDKTGKVDSKSLVEAFEKLSKAKFGNAINNQMGTLQGQLSNLTDRVEFFAMKVGGPIFDTAKQALSGLFSFLDAHQKQIDVFADAVGGGLANAFKFLGTAVTGVVGFFSSHQAAVQALGAAFIGLGGALLALLGATIIPLIPVAITAVGGRQPVSAPYSSRPRPSWQ